MNTLLDKGQAIVIQYLYVMNDYLIGQLSAVRNAFVSMVLLLSTRSNG